MTLPRIVAIGFAISLAVGAIDESGRLIGRPMLTQYSLRPFNAGTGSVSEFQLRCGDVLAMNAVPGIWVVSPRLVSPASISAMRTSGIVCDRRPATPQATVDLPGDDATHGGCPDDDIIPAPLPANPVRDRKPQLL
jgi:hypothetical protein